VKKARPNGPTRPIHFAAVILATVFSATALPGCALFESAGEVTIGKGQIATILLDFQLPNHDNFVAQTKAALDDVDGIPEGTSIESATLAHILGMVKLSGHCVRSFSQAGKKDLGAGSDMVSNFIACPDTGVCDAYCGDRRGVVLQFEVDTIALDQSTSKDIKSKVQQRIEDTLVGMRLKIDTLMPYKLVNGKRVDMLPHIRSVIATAVDPDGNEVDLMNANHLRQIREGGQPRVTFDPDSKFTKGMIRALEKGQAVQFRLRAEVHILRADAYVWPIFKSGFRLEAQPEFVISVLGGVT